MTPHPQQEPPPARAPSLPVAADDPHEECSHCGRSYSSSEPWTRAVKRKADDDDGEMATEGSGGAVVPVRPHSVPPPGGGEWQGTMEEELYMLREEVAEQQRTIQELCEELDEERNASTIATNEAMTMILRLQREKAEAVLEARQFKRFAEERMEQDQQDIAELEQEARALNEEMEEYKARLEELAEEYRCRIDELEEYKRQVGELEEYKRRRLDEVAVVGGLKGSEAGDGGVVDGVPDRGVPGGLETGEVDKYESFHVEPQAEEEEEEEEPATPAAVGGSDQEEAVTANSPQLSRSSSFGTADSFVAVDAGGGDNDDQQDMSSSVVVVDHTLDATPHPGRDDDDESSDRVYTIDAVHELPLPDPPAPAPIQSATSGIVISQDDFRLLQMRLFALEEDRDALKHALGSIRPNPAAAAAQSASVWVWDMFQNLTKAPIWDMLQNLTKAPIWDTLQNLTKARIQLALQQGMGLLKIHHLFWAVSLLPLLKWIVPLLFYRRKKDNLIRATQAAACGHQH